MQSIFQALKKGISSSTFRIACLLSAVAVFAVGLLLHFEIRELSRRYREATEEPLVDLANVLATLVESELVERGLSTLDAETLAAMQSPYVPLLGLAQIGSRKVQAQIYSLQKQDVDTRVYITDQKGRVLFDTRGSAEIGLDYSHWNDVARTLRGQYGARSSRESKDGSLAVLYAAAPIRLEERILGVVSVGKPTRSAKRFTETASDSSVFIALCIIAGIIFTSALVAWYFSGPLRRFTRYVQALARGQHVAPPRLQGYELRELLGAFESLRAELEGKKYVERYVQTLTHELKSPLTAIYGASELLRDTESPEERGHLLDSIDRESQRLRTLVDKMLALAALESGSVKLERQRLSLSELVREIADSYRAVCTQQNIALTLQLDCEASIVGDRFWLREAVSNILQNALEFSSTGGTIEITLRDEPAQVVLEVLDSGPGIPEWALPRIFERFYSLERPNEGRRSSGLGLAIAKEILELHTASIQVSNRDPKGARVVLRFPRVDGAKQ